ncbi:MAG: UDP-N-acetylmuramoyl-tripeptide--D-alanyl-D-alanine ligase [Treponema sp.]|nr:UDP-N-acetylmuramoyl-tripeptide--D-alanyl-D-alanine ligase [Spirochaetia bacterium]MDD7459708.1 UDP-N-acetylmuramoyl-tripeptide--D-alanyl-D-alanine ligase [Spirochaetales bacterium]MDY5811700.1 UDP-N-acetylmuramoyl-tripeptide--D-alanyl-D-alanine ligase [Treponema sp.]
MIGIDKSLLTLEKLLEATDGVHVLGPSSITFTSVTTDSRSVEKDSLFVPLIGENQDGHKYIPQAIEKGAGVIFIAKKNFEDDSNFFVQLHHDNPGVTFIAVDNTMTALQKAAGAYVEKFPHLIKIAITGSSGKTTTKEILVSIMKQKYNVICNKGNLNSETGLPLSVFNIRPEHECGIFEMGMNRQNEIGEISAVLKANFAIITNIGTAHIGILGSRENIAKEKAKVFDHFHNFGTGVIPYDDDFVDFLKDQIEGKVVLYGKDTETVKYAADLGLGGTSFTVGGIKAVLSIPGKYNYKNALGAIALAEVLGLSSGEIAKGINELKPMFGRSQVLEGKYTIVQDCYNANPDSMEKSIEFVSSVNDGRKKVFVLGDMLELGQNSAREHEKAGELAANSSADVLIFAGDEMKAAFEKIKDSAAGKEVFYFNGKSDDTMKAIAEKIKSAVPEKSIVLIKGSRGMGLERITEILEGGSK